ncbi:hypothetical protein TNCT_662481 [Trichonephila clavata]|uniref:Uncharacterized protein n=1 Tax=Trichonephila clavata TaxID=2740835 RepID=A0A8X6GUV4_TRICU|nr:hypothetical protein TNCT_662481 [Trichonephila clavata]
MKSEQREEWEKAMSSEIETMHNRGVWHLEKLPEALSEELSDIEDFHSTDVNSTVVDVKDTTEMRDFCLSKIQDKKTEYFYAAEITDVKEHYSVKFLKNIALSHKFLLYDKEETYEIDNRNILFKFPKPQSVGASKQQ